MNPPRVTYRLLASLGFLSLASGCAEDRCANEPPSFQLDLAVVDLDLASRVEALDVELRFLDGSYTRRFAVEDTLADGETSLAVELDPAPTEDFGLQVTVHALASGTRVASGEQLFEGHPNGCNRFELSLRASAEPGDAGTADLGRDAPGTDLAGPDARPTDAGPDDTGVLPPDAPCVTRIDDDVLLLYTFDEVPAFTTTVADAREAHPAFARPVGTMVDRAASRPDCGLAARFSGESHLEVPHSDEFDLASGSLDFWFSAPAPTVRSMEGIMSRDASGTVRSGHLGIYRDCQGYIIVRVQRADGPDVYRCSDRPVAPDQWVHLALNFGPPALELYVDGSLSTNTSTTAVLWDCSTPVACGAPASYGIDGNENPFVLGASSHNSLEGLATPTTRPLSGQIDSFRLSRIRRSF